MKKLNIKIFIPIYLGFFALLCTGCNGDKVQEKILCSDDVQVSAINPNGDSELATLMRQLHIDADSLKQLIINKQGNISEEFISELERSHNAIPTDPKVKTPEFKAYTELIINQARKLQTSTGNQEIEFNQLVNSCINCHARFCPGPIVKIEKLRI